MARSYVKRNQPMETNVTTITSTIPAREADLLHRLTHERRVFWIAESGFLVGAIGCAWLVGWLVPSAGADLVAVAMLFAAAGAFFAMVVVIVYRLMGYRRWRRGERHRLERVLYGKSLESKHEH